MAAGAVFALMASAPSGTTSEQRPLRFGEAAAVAGSAARVVTTQTPLPRGTAVSQLGLATRGPYALERAAAADRLADARAAAGQRAAVSAAGPAGPAARQGGPPTGEGSFSSTALEHLWVSAGGPRWAAAQAASIAECESGGNPRAYNPSGATGLWQILGQVVPGNLFDPLVNAENAVAKFRASGDTFAQWVC